MEEAPPGAELRLHDVAERAGLVRTVVQRHFGSSVQLTRAVQADTLEQAFARIMRPVDLSMSLHQLAMSMVGETVDWVESRPGSHALVEREVGDGRPSELSAAISGYADFLVDIVRGVARGRGVDLADSALVETRLVFVGVIGLVRATVSQWRVEQSAISAAQVQRLLADEATAMVVRHGAAIGLRLAADQPLL